MKKRLKKPLICIFGASLDVQNQGCRALAVSLLQLISNQYPDADFFYLYGHHSPGKKVLFVNGRKITIHIVNSRLSPKSKPNQHVFWILAMAALYRILLFKPIRKLLADSTPWIRVIDNADFIGDIRGGDSFSDIYGVGRIFWGSMPCFITILMKKRLVLLPQTYGPYNSWISRVIARYIFNHADKIFARDQHSITTVQSLLGEKARDKHIEFCPDVAFALEHHRPDTIAIAPPFDENHAEDIIGLNISGLLYHGGYTENNMFNLSFDYKTFIIELIDHIMKKTDAHVLLVPHVFSKGVESDVEVCKKVMSHFGTEYKNRLHYVTQDYNQNEIKYIIGQCDFFIGSRMHACIAALSQNIPAIGIAYSKKFLGVFESVNLGNYVIDARNMDKAMVIESCLNLYKNRENAKDILIENVESIKREVSECFTYKVFDIS